MKGILKVGIAFHQPSDSFDSISCKGFSHIQR